MRKSDIQKLLSEQIIDENQPSSILRDFETFLDFVADNDIKASGKMELLSLKFLPQLNSRLTKPLDIKLKRPVQKSFANINGLYLLARTAGLLILQKKGKGQHFAIDEEALKRWQKLNPAERYFTLVETWIVRSSVETIGEHDSILSRPIFGVVRLFEDINSIGSNVKNNKHFQQDGVLLYGSYNIVLAEMFGWLEITYDKTQTGKSWSIAAIKLTGFGKAFVEILLETFETLEHSWENIALIEDTKLDINAFNLLQPIFQPLFPKWKNTYRLPTIEIKDGVFTFKVLLDKTIWRRIAISSNDVLDDLHYVIQSAFDFDNDHLYQFEFRNRFGIRQRVPHPMCEGDIFTNEFEIKDLPLRIGETMEYIFDFGDWWVFTIELEEIKPPAPEFTYAEILEEHGKAPEQYPDWDEDGEW